MVHLSSIAGFAVLYVGIVSGAPMPDSAVGNEVGVSAPNGIPVSDTQQLYQTDSTDMGSGWSQTSSYQTTPTDKGSGWGQASSPYQTAPPSYQTTPPSSYGGSGSSNNWQPQYSSDNSWSGAPAPPASTSIAYGSGSSNWGSGSGYDSCVQQCQAQFGSPTSPPSSSYPSGSDGGSASGGSSGGGATHTVIVAPSQGVLRYVPFAVNASVGDTVKFMWGANNHTVTKSSELTPCNKTSDSPFTSGVQVKDFVFEQVVNDTNPLFFYCGVPNHCQKGMFGIINPPNAMGSSTSVGSMMSGMAANNTQIESMLAYATNATSGNSVASGWGQGIDMSAMPEWAQQYVAEGVLYTQTFLAANPDAIKTDGSIDVGLNGNPAVVPQDIVIAAASYGSPSSSVASVPAPSGTGNPSSSSKSVSDKSGASMVSRSGVLVGFAALGAGLFLL